VLISTLLWKVDHVTITLVLFYFCWLYQKSIRDYLEEFHLLDDDDDQIYRYLSRTILLQHYVAFRVALRK